MGNVGIGFSMSLDGFIAGPNDEIDRLFKWYFMGDTDHTVSSGDQEFKMPSEGAELVEEAGRTVGALVTGRRTFDVAHGVVNTPWAYRLSSLLIGSRKNGSRKARRSRSLRMGLKAPSK